MAMTPEQAKALLSDLFSSAKATPKAAKAAKPRSARIIPDETARPITLKGVTKRGLLPAMRLITVMHQHCDCCGSDQQYVKPGVVRFEKKSNGAALEIPASVMETLPVSIINQWENTPYCPVCIAMGAEITAFTSAASRPAGTQLELFA